MEGFHFQQVLIYNNCKTLNYESNPHKGENWFQRACLAGDPSTSGISCVISNENINEMLDIVGFEEVNTVYKNFFKPDDICISMEFHSLIIEGFMELVGLMEVMLIILRMDLCYQ